MGRTYRGSGGGVCLCRANMAQINKAVKARFRPWLKPLSVQKSIEPSELFLPRSPAGHSKGRPASSSSVFFCVTLQPRAERSGKSRGLSLYIYVYMYICIYVYMYICIYVYICTYVHMYICIYVYTHIYTNTYTYTCIYVYMNMYIHTYIHLHTYIYIKMSLT